MPREFEEAWSKLVQKYNLQNDTMITQMWEDREQWISAYFKNVLCARMTSTQRSESMNYVLKRGFVNARNNLHRFAEQVNNYIFTRGQVERQQTLASMTEPETRTWYGFEKQFSEEYTRAVFKEMKSNFKYRVKPDPDPTLDEHNYLVNFHAPTDAFPWSAHKFKVVADPGKGKYSCECVLWEHTGIFCLHVICMLEHLRVEKVPNEYILRRYTKKARNKETFDRRDYKTVI